MDNQLQNLIALSTFPKFGSRSLLKLKQAFLNLEDVWSASQKSLVAVGLEEKTVQEFISLRSTIEPTKELTKLEKENIRVIDIDDDNYPPLLKEIYDPPALLYYRGSWEFTRSSFPLAVVGSRKVTAYGKLVIEEIVGSLARQGLTIVSGLAIGVDTLAHQTTLQHKGLTVAVLGSGLDAEHIYPVQNRDLAEQIIAQGGAVISEFPIGTLPLRYNFPIRNRIISGLSLGTLIIEAAEDSGSLITARSALEQNREVFSIPGSIFSPLSFGPNNLLKMGAHVVTTAEDILEILHLEKAEKIIENKKILADTAEEAILLKILSREPKHIDLIIKEANLAASIITSSLTLMEMKGKARNLGGMMYVVAGN